MNHTFLQLSQEFGGTKFGPFNGPEIRLGSDPSRNDITLPEALGVAPEHIKVLIQGDGSYILAPVERTAAVFLWRPSSSKPKQLQSPMAVSADDGFSLVTPEGPRFYIQAEAAKQADLTEVEGAHKYKKQGPLGGRIMGEIQRRGFASFLTTSVGNQAYRAWMFIRSGQMFSPFYIVSGFAMLSGFVFAGGSSCAAVSFSQSAATARDDLATCEDQLGRSSGSGGGADPTVAQLTGLLLGDNQWDQTLSDDKKFREAFARSLKLIFTDIDRYRWVYQTPKGTNAYAEFESALVGTGLDPRLVRVLSYAAANPTYGRQEMDFSLIPEDSEGKEVCGRGVLKLTYRQASNLSLYELKLDANAPRGVVNGGVEGQVQALRETMFSAGRDVEFDQTKIATAGLQGPTDCLFISGEDERTRVDATAEAIQRTLSVAKLPKPGQSYWVLANLLKVTASDLARGFEEFEINTGSSPTVQMDQMATLNTQRKRFIIDQAAAIAARAVAIPCMKGLDTEWKDKALEFIDKPKPPNIFNCGGVKIFVDYELF